MKKTSSPKPRKLDSLLNEICKEQNLTLIKHSDNWVYEISNGKKSTFTYGYKFANNSATTMLVCNDKAATSDILTNHNIPVVEHKFFMQHRHSTVKSITAKILPLLSTYHSIVLKNNLGSGGRLIYKVSTKRQLVHAIKNILKHSKFIAVSPYYDISQEFRCMILNNKVELIYEKVRPYIVGDGKRTLKQIVPKLSKKRYKEMNLKPKYIPTQGEKVTINWKHNLFSGATANIDIDDNTKKKLSHIALSTAKTLQAKFASVDVVNINGEYRVLEVNSGVMMEKFSTFTKENHLTAKTIYTQAILACLK